MQKGVIQTIFFRSRTLILTALNASILAITFGVNFFVSDTYAHTATLTTSGTININVSPAGVGGSDGGSIGVDNLIVNSTCPIGYTVSISGLTDNTLYKDGDNTNTGTNQKILASSGTTQSPASILGNNLGTWGYTTGSNITTSSNFIGLTSSTVTLATKNAASGDGSGDPTTGIDTIPVYYGVSATATLEPGLYQLAESSQGADDNVITYYLTTSAVCDTYYIRYNDNGANSTTTMGDQTISASATSVDLKAPTYHMSGYGYAGWNTRADGAGTNFGPMETVNGTALQTLMSQAVLDNNQLVINLYAKWVQSAGNIQSWTGCSSLASGAVTALTDARDSRTYAVAKLADGKCWMIENLKLHNQTNTDNATGALAQGYDSSFVGLANSEEAWATDSSNTTANSLYSIDGSNNTTIISGSNQAFRFPRHNIYQTSAGRSAVYSYGNYYTWPAVVADTGDYTTSNQSITTTSICPTGWHVPTGNTNGEFYNLNTSANAGSTSTSSGLRAFPNNFLYSGYIYNSSYTSVGTVGLYWSSTIYDGPGSRLLSLSGNNVNPGTSINNKSFGLTVRCISSEPYTIHFDANGGTGTMSDQTAFVDNAITLTSNAFTKSGFIFVGWNTAADGSGTAYADGASVINLPTTNGVATLYAQWSNCDANKVCYNDNGANSSTTMGNQTISTTATSITLWPSNFKRSGYGFAGWNTKADGTGTNYGPMETITITAGQYSTAGLQLYAKWVQSAGNLQGWTGCSSLAAGAVTALTDQRDNNTYAVAKLADGKCWMIENLRLNNTNSDNTTGALAQGYSSSFVGLANAESPWAAGSTSANSLYSTNGSGGTMAITGSNQSSRFPRYNNNNTNSAVTNMTTNSANIYSYGNYYTWSAVIADTGNYDFNNRNQPITTTSICPADWRLPQGGDKVRIESNDDSDYWNLIVGGLNNSTNPTNYSSEVNPYYTGAAEAGPISNALRAFPNNFLYSGYISGSITSRGSYGGYWSSTVGNWQNASGSYTMSFDVDDVRPGASSGAGYAGFTARCVSSDTYTIHFNANGGTGTMSDQTAFINNTNTLVSNTFTKSGSAFVEWNTAADGSGTIYADGASVTNLPTINNAITLYAQWNNCPANRICYDDNGANSTTTMGNQTISASDTEIILWASNFKRNGYGFAGWNTKANGTGTNYGPNETITITAGQYSTAGLQLYAKWVQSAGNIQSWTGCSSMNTGDVTALTDTRDNDTYAVAKLADGKCWMIENLRLDNTATINSSNTSNPVSGFALATPVDPSVTNWCTTDSSACDDQSMLFTGNTNNAVSNMTDIDANIYSYGNYYNWYSATVGNGVYSMSTDNTRASGDICPTGWHLPSGGSKTNINAGKSEFYNLSLPLVGAAPANFASQSQPYWIDDNNTEGTDASRALTAYPNNFIYSGCINGTLKERGAIDGGYGGFWSATVRNDRGAYRLGLHENDLYPGTGNGVKHGGVPVRCVASDQYTIQFNANGGTGTMNSQSAFYDNATTLTSNSFTKSGYGFAGWNTAADGSGTAYANGASVINLPTTNGVATLYAQWGCQGGRICYDDNGANSSTTMGKETVSDSATSIMLWPSNFKRSGYGFAGWNTKADGTGTNYGPMETITITAGQYSTLGLQLYAKWVQSAGNIQSWTGCSSMSIGDVTALTDTRDNNTYAVAKLADGKCWMIENLRLDNTATHNSDGTLAQGYNSSFVGLADPESPWASNSTTANSLYSTDGSNNTTAITGNSQVQRFPRYNNNNTNNTVANMTTSSNANIYSYGNYYTWSAVVADTSYYTTEQSITATSICPKGWRLPQGGDKTRIESNDDNDYWNLVVDGLNNGTNPTNYNSSANPYYTGAAEAGPVDNALRAFPNNFLYSGFVNASTYSSISSRGSFSYYWSSTAINQLGADYLYFYSTHVLPGTNSTNKYLGLTVRCISSDAYTIHFDSNGGTGTMGDQTAFEGNAATLTSNAFTKSGSTFIEWNTAADGSGTAYADGASVIDLPTTNGVATLYAQWSNCPANYVCYNDNGANSSTKMGNQSVSSTATSITFRASNFQRSNYGFAGWNTKADGTGTNYGPNQTITITAGQYSTAGLQLYAKWVQSAGNIQDWTGCNSLTVGTVTALTDTRDNNTYAVARLNDGKCWMIENLRLNNTAALTSNTTDNMLSGFMLSASQNPTAWCRQNSTTCMNASYFYSDNTANVVTTMTGTNQNVYGYGNYYNWYSATAGRGLRSTTSAAQGSICPRGWRLPTGGTSSQFNTLNQSMNSGATNTSAGLRAYPANFILSGYIYSSLTGRGAEGSYWSITGSSNNNFAYALDLTASSVSVTGTTNTTYKYSGAVVRCIKQ